MKQGDLDTAASMGEFAGDNYDSMSQLNKGISNKEQELQNIKLDLVASKVCHKQEVHLLKHEHEEKLKQLKKNNDYFKHRLENSDVLSQQ